MRPILLAMTLAATLAAASPTAAQPTWWITVGGQATFETGRLGQILGVGGGGGIAAGWHLLRLGPVLLGPELEGIAGKVSADLGTVSDDVRVLRGRAGVRVTWWEEDEEPLLVPYVRGGLVYRADSGKFISDEGGGFYVGAGLDFRLSDNWSVGPFVAYEHVSLSIDADTFMVGLGLTFSWGD
jgi:opacity protein-like surface antigen